MRTSGFGGRVQQTACHAILRLIASVAGDRPVPVAVVRAVRLLDSGDDPLIPETQTVDGGTVADPSLAVLLRGMELGTWALGPKAIDVVVTLVAAQRPDLIIEFGSGASTLVLAWATKRLGGDGLQPRIISIEQDAGHARRTRALLDRSDMGSEVLVIEAPLKAQTVEGFATVCYDLPGEFWRALDGRKADLVLIDGPAAESAARFGTLPLIREHVRAAPFILDDALRDGELEIARRWRRLSYIHIGGIRLVEKGLLVGVVGQSNESL